MVKRIVILGSTGSIGENALGVVRHLADRFRVTGVVARQRVGRLAEQAREFGCAWAYTAWDEGRAGLAEALPAGCRSLAGEAELLAAVTADDVDMVLCAIVGTSGLAPVLAAIRAGKDIALASKEILVMAGEIVMAEARRHGVQPLTEASAAAATDRDGLDRLMHRGARVIYLPPAPSAIRYAPLVLEAGRQMQVRVVSSLPEGTRKGAVLWVALDYRRLGEDLGDLARRILAGEAPKTIPIVEQTPLQVEVDETLARKWSGYPPAIN